MITEDYVSFETAKLLKEKGFDEATNRYYNAQYDQIRTVSDTFLWHWNDEEFMKRIGMSGAIAIPTLQMAMKWLLVMHHLLITPFSSSQESWMFRITTPRQRLEDGVYGEDYETREEACEAAIKYCLEKLV